MKVPILLLIAVSVGAAEMSFEARWKRILRPDVEGVLSIGEESLAFRPTKKRRPTLKWALEDVQHLDRASPAEVVIQTYADSLYRLGGDRRYRFVLSDGEIPDDLYASVVARVGKPATDRVVREPVDVEMAIAVKHVRPLRGSEGMLYFTPEWILYQTDRRGQSRAWRIDRDVQGVWSSDRFRLEVHVWGGSEAFFRRVDIHRFSLKSPLDSSYYDGLRLKLHSLRSPR